MNTTEIFLLQFVMSVFVFAMIARLYVAPWLASLTLASALSVLLLPHAFRHIGLSFLVPNLNTATMPANFSAWAGYGDLVAAALAIIALLALHARARLAVPLIWVFNLVGFADLLNALRQAGAIDHFGATWFIPTFLVPLLLVSHVMIFFYLLKGSRAHDVTT